MKKDLLTAEKPIFEEEGHKYYSPMTGKELTSVTTVYKDFFSEFDADEVLDDYYDKWQDEEDPRYHGKSREEIIDMWEANRDLAAGHGTIVHDAIERYLLGEIDLFDIEEMDDQEASRKVQQAVIWQNKSELLHTPQFVFPEEQIYSDELGIAGTIDLLYVTEDNEVILIDWKSNSKISDRGFYNTDTKSTEKAHYPLHNMEDCALAKYTMQLSTYAHVLEEEYTVHGQDLKVKGLILPWLKEDKIKEFFIPYEKDKVIMCLKESDQTQ